MKLSSSTLIKLLVLNCLAILCASQDFDFFYFVQQWPGSYCDSRQSCCYPKTGKPVANFTIHGLWPNFQAGSYPSNCDPDSHFDPSKISDLMSGMRKDWPSLACPSSDSLRFWSHEWTKHGTCSESVINEHEYFETALNLKRRLDFLKILGNAGIRPNGRFYSLRAIKDAISKAIGQTPWIECNVDPSGNRQLYQIYVCVDTSGTKIIECPVMPHGRCASRIEFPSF